mgnify:FL=1
MKEDMEEGQMSTRVQRLKKRHPKGLNEKTRDLRITGRCGDGYSIYSVKEYSNEDRDMDAEFPNFFEKEELCDECGRDSKTYVQGACQYLHLSITRTLLMKTFCSLSLIHI